MMRKCWLLLFIIPASFELTPAGNLNELNINNGTWTLYAERLELYFKANNIKEDLKVPLLLTLIGDDAYQLLVNSVTPKRTSDLTYEEASEWLQGHLEPNSFIHEGRYLFRQATQNDKMIFQYVEELQRLSRKCKFGMNLGENLRDQFVYGLRNDVIRRRLFAADDGLSFPEAVQIAAKASLGTGSKVEQICQGVSIVPSTCSIPTLSPDRLIRVKGSTSTIAQRFSINLQLGPSTSLTDDIALHLAVRFDEKTVVLNHQFTSLGGSRVWGREVREPNVAARGEPFEVLILCEESGFKISINGKPLKEFEHRVLYQRITHINFDGDVTVEAVTLEDNKHTQH